MKIEKILHTMWKENMSSASKLIVMYLYHKILESDSRGIYISNLDFSEILGCSKQFLYRQISKLEKSGFLRIRKESTRQKIHFITFGVKIAKK